VRDRLHFPSNKTTTTQAYYPYPLLFASTYLLLLRLDLPFSLALLPLAADSHGDTAALFVFPAEKVPGLPTQGTPQECLEPCIVADFAHVPNLLGLAAVPSCGMWKRGGERLCEGERAARSGLGGKGEQVSILQATCFLLSFCMQEKMPSMMLAF